MDVYQSHIWHPCKNGFKNMFPHMAEEIVANNEIVYRNRPEFKEFEGKNVLLVGGGPSSLKLTAEDLEQYDSIWSMSHFFLNPLLSTTKVDLAMLSFEVDLNGGKLQSYLKEHDPFIGFEWNPKFGQKSKHIVGGKFHDLDKLFCMHTRFYSKLGYGVRMIIFAAELKVRRLSFVGLDGPKPIFEGSHAFEKGKKKLPSGIDQANAAKVFDRQYKLFWEYVHDYYPDIKLDSIDKENQFHAYISEAQSC